MAVGFVFIAVYPQKEREVYEKLQSIRKATEIYAITGEYDFVVKIQTEDFVELGKIVIQEIRTMDGVKETRTIEGMKL